MAAATMQDYMVLNQQQRNAVLANAVVMKQQIQSVAVAPATQSVLNFAPRNVGLIKGFIVEISGNILNGAGTALALTGGGSANILKNLQFTDLNNNVRINVPGWYLALLNSARQGWGYGGVYANNIPMGYGNNWTVDAAPATIAISGNANVKHTYYVPLAYSGDDLRGAIYAGVVSATMNLQITLNTTPCVATGADPMNAVYIGNAAGAWSGNVTVNVYQIYLDQLPVMNGGPVLPIMDLNTIYELKQTTMTGLAVGQDFPIPYANFRDFLSTTAVFDNGGTFNSGSDVNYWSITSANFTNLLKLPPAICALEARQTFMADPPAGWYYFSHRDRPINTLAYGNMQLNINASTVNANASVLVGFEAFAQVNQLLGSAGASLPAG
jgi:hypothetical protein